MYTVTSYGGRFINNRSPLGTWDDLVYSKKLNAFYLIEPSRVRLRHIMYDAQRVGALKIGHAFEIEIGPVIRSCFTVIDEFLYINTDRRLNLLTGEIEAVCNPLHKKCRPTWNIADFLPMDAPGAPEEVIEVTSIKGNTGKHTLSIVDVNLSHNDIVKWLDASGRDYGYVDDHSYLLENGCYSCKTDFTKCTCKLGYSYNRIYKENGVPYWRLVVNSNDIRLINTECSNGDTTYNEYNDFILEYQPWDEDCYRILFVDDDGNIDSINGLEPYAADDDNVLLSTYYFITVEECENALEICHDLEIDYENEKGPFGEDTEELCNIIPEYGMVRQIEPRFIEATQAPTFIKQATIYEQSQYVFTYKSEPVRNASFLYSGETLYNAEYEESALKLSAPDGTTYELDISPFKRDDNRRPLFYMRGDTIYALQGYMNIKTGEFTAAPNSTLEYHCEGRYNDISFDFGPVKHYVAGQFLVTYNALYYRPVEIEGFRALVNGNISIYEYAGVSKVKIPTRTKPALRE